MALLLSCGGGSDTITLPYQARRFRRLRLLSAGHIAADIRSHQRPASGKLHDYAFARDHIQRIALVRLRRSAICVGAEHAQ